MPVLPSWFARRGVVVRGGFAGLLVAVLLPVGFAADVPETAAADRRRLEAVRTYADHVLADASDHVHQPASPLLANGVNLDTKAPVEWVFADGKSAIVSDLTTHQNLFRVLAGLTALTGDAKYKAAAKAEIAYYFDHFQDSSGLLHWGGHRFIDLRTLTPVGIAEKGGVHELKNVFPYYELMYETNPAATVKFLTACWNAHIYNWRTLEVSRHGEYGHPPGAHWDEPFDNPAPYFETKGLSFLDAGNDLIYAATSLYRLNGDRGALLWGGGWRSSTSRPAIRGRTLARTSSRSRARLTRRRAMTRRCRGTATGRSGSSVLIFRGTSCSRRRCCCGATRSRSTRTMR